MELRDMLKDRVCSLSLSVAKQFGLREAIVLQAIFTQLGSRPTKDFSFLSSFFDDYEDIVLSLKGKGLLKLHGNHGYQLDLSFEEGEEFEFGEIAGSIFFNADFKALLAKWKNILKDKGITKSDRDIKKIFEGRSLDEAMRALKRSVDNRFLSVNFFDESKNDERKETNFNKGSYPKARTGGSSGPGGDNGGAKNNNSAVSRSRFSKLVSGLEE